MLRGTLERSRLAFFLLLLLVLVTGAVSAWEPLAVRDDPLVRMPGTQPGDGVKLEGPNRCLNCHAGYDRAVEPGFNWGGSMMTHAARDPLFWATMAVAAQDAIWAVGNPNGTDLCLRCHFPKGWLEGRSDPTNAAAMAGDDYDGVQCDFCHRLVDPHFAATHAGTRESADTFGYWDETDLSDTPSAEAAMATREMDRLELSTLTHFDGQPYLGQDDLPAETGYTEATGGQFFVAADAAKRGPFADAEARHPMLYSRFHKSRYFCATCHDVSNPLLANLGDAHALPGDGAGALPSEIQPAHAYFHVERTFSEFMLSAYGTDGGAAGVGPFAPDRFVTSQPGNVIARCQDCHMRDVTARGADKRGVPLRPDGSLEHPKSALPLHDLTGGNALMAEILASAVPGSPNHDPVNDALLNQGPAVLTLDLGAGQGIDPGALLAGRDRARQQLGLAATIADLAYDATRGEVTFKVVNQSGHKLISGYPEGRRMFVNVRVYAADGTLLHEVNPYDAAAATLKGLHYAYADPYPDFEGALPPPAPLAAHERYVDALVYEAALASTLTMEEKTFHFVLGTHRAKDNRIPPRGFRVAEAAARMVQPVRDGAPDTTLYDAAEYAGGHDAVALATAPGGAAVEVRLYYQTTSREYVQFLSDEIDGRAWSLPGPGMAGDPAYLAQDDPFFAGLKAWGGTIWKLWKHNRTLPGAAPLLMAEASVGMPVTPACLLPVPTLLAAEPGHQKITLAWSGVHEGDEAVQGFSVYYDQAGKLQRVAETGLTTTYADAGLTNGQLYCYRVAARGAACESAVSNLECTYPSNRALLVAGAESLASGTLEKVGKGRDAALAFVEASGFAVGEAVAFRLRVVAGASGQPLAGATVQLKIDGAVQTTLTSGASDADGVAYATWTTAAPNRKGRGGTPPGSYTAAVIDVDSGGYDWDGNAPVVGFELR